MNPASPEKQFVAEPTANFRVNKGKTWNRRVALVGLGLLVILPVSFTSFDFRLAKAPSQGQMASTRSGWYLSSGQWRADVRTLAAAFDYVMDWMPGTPTGPSSPTNQLASLETPIVSDSLVATQANAGRYHFPRG
jgi:hypothetical protein